MIARVTFGLVKFAFTSDDPKLRTRLFDAILDGRCPDFECSLGSPSKTGSSYTAMWLPEHVAAVLAWAQSIGIHVSSTDCTTNHPMTSIQLPDVGDIAPGGVVGPCISDAERMLADQGMEPTARNWIAVCDHFLSQALICSGRSAAFRLLRQAIENAALATVKIDPRPVPRAIAQETLE